MRLNKGPTHDAYIQCLAARCDLRVVVFRGGSPMTFQAQSLKYERKLLCTIAMRINPLKTYAIVSYPTAC